MAKENKGSRLLQWLGRCDSGRILRLLIGVSLVLIGIFLKESLLAVFGAWLLLLGAFNVSCCGSGSCGTSHKDGLMSRHVKDYTPGSDSK